MTACKAMDALLAHGAAVKDAWDDYRAYRQLAVRYLGYARAGTHSDPDGLLRSLARAYAARATYAKRRARMQEV